MNKLIQSHNIMENVNLKNKFYDKMVEKVKKQKWIHRNSADYYDKLHKYVLYPSISITAISSIASFISTSEYVTTNVQNGFCLSIGILASISTLLQSISSNCNYSAKCELHRNASQEYGKLLTKLEFEKNFPNETDFIDKTEAKILDIQTKCKYFPPQFIIDNYEECEHEKTPLLHN